MILLKFSTCNLIFGNADRPKYRLICLVFVSLPLHYIYIYLSLSLSLSSRSFLCGEYMFKTCMFDYFLYSHPASRPYKMTGLLPERLQYVLVCWFLPSLRRSQQFIVKLFSSMSCHKMTGPFRTPVLQKVWLQTVQDSETSPSKQLHG